jgi:hypothetical protein
VLVKAKGGNHDNANASNTAGVLAVGVGQGWANFFLWAGQMKKVKCQVGQLNLLLINKSESVSVCLSVCMYFKKEIYILLPCCITIGYIMYWIYCCTTIKIVAQQLKQVQLL